jgi:hypothetical protein
MVKCFLIVPTGKLRHILRRYTAYQEGACPLTNGSHSAERELRDGVHGEDVYPDADDPAWPAYCDCGYKFREDDHFHVRRERVYRRDGGNQEYTLAKAPPGAMWYADWLADGIPAGSDMFRGPDGRCLMVKCPDGLFWCIDGPSSAGIKYLGAGTGTSKTGNLLRHERRTKMETEIKEQTPLEVVKQFIEDRKGDLEAALRALDAGDFQTARQSVSRAASNLPLVAPLMNEAEGLPAYPQRDIFSAED